jgi:hypothetical protein
LALTSFTARRARQPAAGFDTADTFQVVSQGVGFDGALLCAANVLQRTAATATEDGAFRLHALRRRSDNFEQFGFVEITP